jgi:CSLREA domain-containing protein
VEWLFTKLLLSWLALSLYPHSDTITIQPTDPARHTSAFAVSAVNLSISQVYTGTVLSSTSAIANQADSVPVPSLAEIVTDEWTLADTPWPTYQHDFQRTGRSPYVGITDRPIIWWHGASGNPSALTVGLSNTLFVKSGYTTVYDLDSHQVLSATWPGHDCGSAPTHLGNGSIFYGSYGAFNAFTARGELLWRYLTGNVCIQQTPAIARNGVVFSVVDFTLVAADAASGNPLWSQFMGEFGGSTPALGSDGTLYISSGASWQRGFYALEPNGNIGWSTVNYATTMDPVVGDDGTIYGGKDGLLTAFHPDGSIRWHFAFDEGVCTYSAPAVGPDGTVYFGTIERDNQIPETRLYAIRPDGTEKWHFDVFSAGLPAICGSPIIDGQDNVYFCDDSAVCYALDAGGNYLWDLTFRVGTRTPPIIAANGIMYFGADQGVYQLVDPSVIGSLPIPEPMPKAYLPFVAKSRPTINVNSTADAVDANVGDGVCASASGECTLRAAIQEANAAQAGATILLAAGSYQLTIEGRNEDASSTGDLDITGGVTIQGHGQETSIIDANQLDRVLDVHDNAVLKVVDVAIINGYLANDKGNVYYGGGVRSSGDVSLVRSTISNCQATNGGGFYSYNSSFAFQDSTLCDNRAEMGGGLQMQYGTGTIKNSLICRNHADLSGAGILIDPNGSWPTLAISDTIISDNQAGATGGGIYASALATLAIYHTTISNNQADQGGGIGGGPVLALDITETTINGNRASRSGGGLWVQSYGTKVTNSTISGNQAGEGGGGIYFFGNGNVGTLINATIAENVADGDGDGSGDGGGIFQEAAVSGRTVVRNSIVASNYDGSATLENQDPDCAGVVLSAGYNLIGNNHGCESFVNAERNDLVGSETNPLNPLLGPLQFNGGPTATHALLNGSPAIDSGSNIRCPPTDQRGMERSRDREGDGTDICDMGSFEREAP